MSLQNSTERDTQIQDLGARTVATPLNAFGNSSRLESPFANTISENESIFAYSRSVEKRQKSVVTSRLMKTSQQERFSSMPKVV